MLVSKQNFKATVSKAHVPFFLLQLAFAVKTSSKHKAGVWARPAMAMLWSCHVIWLTVYIDLHWLTLTYIDLHWLTLTYCNTYSDYLRLTLLLILMRYVMILLILTVFCVGTSRLQSTETPEAPEAPEAGPGAPGVHTCPAPSSAAPPNIATANLASAKPDPGSLAI